jgi:hypothetical protein
LTSVPFGWGFEAGTIALPSGATIRLRAPRRWNRIGIRTWGSDTAATQLTSITTEQFFNQVPALNPRETAHVQVSVDFPGSPTDHAIVAVYTTLDDSSEVWDIIPMMEFLIENATDPNRISFLVTGVYKFRVGVRRSGSTDTITSADLSLRKDGVNA